jgi:hypothetical protein
MKSHTGGLMSLGNGAVYTTSTRQNLNTRSFTKAELEAVNNLIPQILRTRNFMISQSFKIRNNTIYQDNRSATLENNGQGSSSKQTQHINNDHFSRSIGILK